MANVDDYARRLLDETRDEITRADGKASILLAGAGVAAAVAGGAFASADLTLSGERGVVQVFCVGAAVLLILGIGAFGFAVFPRLNKGTRGNANYFMDHLLYVGNVAEFRKVVEADAADTVDRDLHQLLALSPIVKRKYRATQLGELLLAAGIGAGGVALLFHVVMCR
jgi:Family of unknown function (DUF5706)